jgi:thymidylate synthase
MLNFEMAIRVESIIVYNPSGTVALCSLWTPPSYVEKSIREKHPELLNGNSPLALIGGLYGGGLKIMLRNLHYNPQLDTIILYGKDFSGAGDHLKNFFKGNIQHTGKKQIYLFSDGIRKELETIVLESPRSVYSMDSLLLPEAFLSIPEIVDLEEYKDNNKTESLAKILSQYHSREKVCEVRPEKIPLPSPEIQNFPTDPEGFSITCDSVMEAWEGIIFRLFRFGVPQIFRNGKERRELLNFKALVRNPTNYDWEKMESHPYYITRSQVDDYVSELLRKEVRDGFNYTYGNRLRSHFGEDNLLKAATDLSKDKDSRHAYISLWDNTCDLGAKNAPCLVSVFFRKIGKTLNLTATFRSHNASKAWPLNALGLSGLLEEVIKMANSSAYRTEPELLVPGSLTIISLSLTLDPNDLADAEKLISHHKESPYRMIQDPNGYFKITLDHESKEIVVDHYSQTSELLTEYRGKTSTEISQKLYKDIALTDIGHALYMGSQLEKAWYCLLSGKEYIQDKKKPEV